MTFLLGSVVDGRALLETVIASFVAGVGVTIVFSLAILGAALLGDARREGRTVAAVGAATLMGFGLLGALMAIAFALVVMMS
jgi:hypothetical protein